MRATGVRIYGNMNPVFQRFIARQKSLLLPEVDDAERAEDAAIMRAGWTELVTASERKASVQLELPFDA